MISPLVGYDFIVGAFAFFFIQLFDWMAYSLVSVSYTVFLAISEINLFGTGSGAELYETIVDQMYTIIGVVMIFFFAYQLILLIIDPDKGAKSASKIFASSVISLIGVIIAPTIFNYMMIFQDHVLRNNTIPAIIMGTNATEDAGVESGHKLATMIFVSFYRPHGTTYTTFYNTDGTLNSESALSNCTASGEADQEVCQTYVDALSKFEETKKISAITGVRALHKAIDGEEGMHYSWIISTVCAVVVAWFFFSYAIDIGTRAVKLGFLQIIAPIPIICRAFPKTDNTFKTWYKEILRTYLEIFFRLAVIFFIVRICQLVPEFINAIFDSTDGVQGNTLVKCIATVGLILGLLNFAKEAPKLVKTLFNSGGDLFSNLNLKPGVRQRIEDNAYLHNATSAVTGIAGGAIGGFGNARRQYAERAEKGQGAAGYNPISSVGHGIYGGLRGALVGGVHGMKTPQEHVTKLSDYGKTFNDNMQHAQKSHNEGNFFERVGRDYMDGVREKEAGILTGIGAGTGKVVKKGVAPIVDVINSATSEEERKLIQGIGATSDNKKAALASLENVYGQIGGLAKGTKDEIDRTKTDFNQKLLQTPVGEGITGSVGFTQADVDAYNNGANKDSLLHKYIERTGTDFESIKSAIEATGKYNGAVSLNTSDYGKDLHKAVMSEYDKKVSDAKLKIINDNFEVAKKINATLEKEYKKHSTELGKEFTEAIAKVAKDHGFVSASDANIGDVDALFKALESVEADPATKKGKFTAEHMAIMNDLSGVIKKQSQEPALTKPKPLQTSKPADKPKDGGGDKK